MPRGHCRPPRANAPFVAATDTAPAAATVTPVTQDPHEQMRRLVTRYFFGSVALTALLSGIKYALLPGPMSSMQRGSLVAGFAVLLAASLASMLWRRAPVKAALTLIALGSTAMVLWAALAVRLGLHHPAIAFLPLMTCLVSGVAGPRPGLAMAGLSALAIAALATAEAVGWLQPGGIGAHLPLASQLVTHALLLVGGLAGGMLLSRVVAGFVDESAERERRFLGLLWIAADAYWELDDEYRLVALWEQRIGSHGFVPMRHGQGRRPWEMAQMRSNGERLQLLQRTLSARQPFRNLRMQWSTGDGDLRHVLLSGEPRTDAQGRFAGYWGVSRDATEHVRAHDALAATEIRYRELFHRIQSPLVLHRDGRVIEANPAAVALFGYPDLATMRAHHLLEVYEPGEVRDRARRRIAMLDALPVGASLPTDEFRLRAHDGRDVVVRSTGVRVEAEGGPATLSTYLDDTERKAAEDAVRRSEALLSHLVATSPDVITLTEMATGRYEMVNDTFLLTTGYTREEVIGRTSVELGVWHDAADRERLVAAMRDPGRAQNMPAEFVGKQGQRISLLVSAARFEMDGRDYLVINARDVTDIERTRKELEAILQNASIGIAFTRGRRFVRANERCEAMFGWPRGGLDGQPGEVVWGSASEYEAMGREVGPLLAAGEQAETERVMMRRDGSRFLCRILAKAVDPTRPREGGTIWILDDVTERRMMDQALAKARDDAEAASRAKSSFLANTSHELRTPLNGLVGMTRLALQPDIDEAQRSHYLEQINDSAESLSAIINDILDLSKIEAGKLHLEELAFDLRDLLQALHRGYGTLATARGLQLHLEVDPEVPRHVVGDPVRVRQILSNYLSNALKFTPHGAVWLSARVADGERLRFEVVDTGPGIAPEVQARLFRPFVQADQSTTRRYGGTGLGLSICHELAALMRGRVGVDSEPGRGSRFWVELPLPATEVAEERSVFGSLEAGDPMQGARVLMVEDNPVNMLIATALLEQWGVKVTQASTGPQAIEAVDQAADRGLPFHAVLMDVQMPDMSGHEATRVLRRRHDDRELPIIALTAAALVSERDEALAAGMNDFLTKPIDAQRLRRTLWNVLAQRRGVG